ncbi:LAME_0G10044g1_1 [Lachancea meyersii CBS 8951]|uniref:phosphoserine transaminase n=1 Tax=Lachancea meyersii CBS 8951 TaxID=1266667 RepID=A0A1G4K8U4_9SACH|nr:LAME_0G10044g1_1 [Lachancea meyersii CBS 8951]
MSLEREEPSHFGAGPAQLPTKVLQQAAQDLVNYNGIGLGIGEISHRSGDASNVIDSAKANLRKLMKIPDTHEVFFMQGGGTTGFSSLATNLTAAHVGKTGSTGTAGYLVTGSWSAKSLEEAQRLGIKSEAIFNAKDFNNGKFGVIPPESAWADKLKAKEYSYIYLCENETVHGIEWPKLPTALTDSDVDIVADLSSDILSREIDVSQYSVIMAGAQKNIGLAGLTIYIMKKSILENISATSLDQLRQLGVPITPIAFDYPTVVKNNSAYNTIPIFTLHVIDLVLRQILEKGGVAVQQKDNELKAELLYKALSKYPDFYALPVAKDCRSKMNVVFTLKKEGLDKKFLDGAAAIKLTGLKGHRSVGGFRASLYNAVSVESTKKLAQFVEAFASKNA